MKMSRKNRVNDFREEWQSHRKEEITAQETEFITPKKRINIKGMLWKYKSGYHIHKLTTSYYAREFEKS